MQPVNQYVRKGTAWRRQCAGSRGGGARALIGSVAARARRGGGVKGSVRGSQCREDRVHSLPEVIQ